MEQHNNKIEQILNKNLVVVQIIVLAHLATPYG
jgi:hypothetical protein